VASASFEPESQKDKMREKNRIIIPTGAEPETPHFDAEETLLSARPVVPLTEQAVRADHNTRADVAARPVTKRLPLLALIIIAAVSVGLASGLAIGLYQGRQSRTAPVAAQPSSTATTVDAHIKQKPAEETSQPPLPSVQTVIDTDKPTELSQPESSTAAEKTTKSQASPEDSETQKPKQQAAPDEKTPDEKQSLPTAASRKKPQDERAGDDGEKKREKTAQRRTIDEQDRDVDIPRTVERANQELNRIREIFEGPQP
jgi:hypothetical protein